MLTPIDIYTITTFHNHYNTTTTGVYSFYNYFFTLENKVVSD